MFSSSPITASETPATTAVGIAAHQARLQETRDGDLLEQENQTLAATLEILHHAEPLDQLSDTAIQITDDVRQLTSAQRVWLLWRDASAQLRVLGESSAQATSSSSRDALEPFLAAAAEEVIRRGEPILLPQAIDRTRHATRCAQQLMRQMQASTIVAHPLDEKLATGPFHPANGAILVADGEPSSTITFLTVATPMLARRLRVMQEREPTPIQRVLRRTFRRFETSSWRICLIAFAILALLSFLPVHYNIRTDCVLQPVQRRFVAAAADGPLANTLVEPGDRVSAGQLIARIDPQELDFQIAGLRAELQQAEQQHQLALIEHDASKQRIGELEMERIENQLNWLEHQRSELEVRSPIDGVVVSGDWKQSEQTPVTRGQTLFEIAPLTRMLVEVRIAEQDYQHIEPGMPLLVKLDALPGRQWHAEVRNVHPRAELVDDRHVFIAEAVIDDEMNALRPGMQGRSVVYSHPHSIAWIWLHRPLRSAARWLGW